MIVLYLCWYSATEKHDNDAVVVSCLRTAIGKARKGGFAGLFVEELLTPLLQTTLERTGVAPSSIEDVVVNKQP